MIELLVLKQTAAARLGWEDSAVLTVVGGPGSSDEAGSSPSSLIDEIVRPCARQMLAAASHAEVDGYIAERGADGRRLVVRNGSHQPRQVPTPAGGRGDRPRVSDKRTDAAPR